MVNSPWNLRSMKREKWVMRVPRRAALSIGPALSAAILLFSPVAASGSLAEIGADGASIELALPPLPEAQVTLTAADRLQGALAAGLSEALTELSSRLSRKERDAIASFYTGNEHRPLWLRDGGFTTAATSLIARLKAAHEDGLDPRDYLVPPSPSTALSAKDRAAVEVKLSAAAVLYARDARGGRIDPSRLSALLTPQLHLPSAGEVLGRLAAAESVGEALATYNPQHPGYRALKAKLAEVRSKQPSTPMVRVPPSTGVTLAAAGAAALKTKPSRPSDVPSVGPTDASSARLANDLIANMERWRWLPPELGERHILVNVPEFRLRMVEDGEVSLETRVVVGKPDSPTPIFSDVLEYVIVNPSWTIPPSILKNEILPALARDPSYAARRGYEVIRRNGQISVRQPPGPRNALGFVKFIFPNDHAVYLHDTPSRNLFAAEQRALSHGCVRVDQPFKLGQQILRSEGWNEVRLTAMIGKGERHIRVKQELPVHLAYFTLAVDAGGQLRNFADVYGYNTKVRTALGLP